MVRHCYKMYRLFATLMVAVSMCGLSGQFMAAQFSPEVTVKSADYVHPPVRTAFNQSDIAALPIDQWRPIKSNYGFSDRAVYVRYVIQTKSDNELSLTASFAQPFPDISEFWVILDEFSISRFF